MSFVLFFIAVPVLFTLFFTNYVLKQKRRHDQELIHQIKDKIEKEKAQLQLLTSEVCRLQIREDQAHQKLLNIQLELLNLEDDLSGIFPRLLN